ncbi:MAG: alpha/beta fold hydrolase [Rubrobacteraceae bacterium]
MYYEVHGEGEPLVVLHGGFGAVGMFARLLPALVETRQVIVVELQSHGHTADIDRPFSFEFMGDDIAALISHLGHERAYVSGYSLGGGVALQTAIRHPAKVRKLVIVSTPCKRDGWYPEVLAGMESIRAEEMADAFIHDAYLETAPNPEDWTKLADKSRRLLSEDYDWSEDVAAMEAPTREAPTMEAPTMIVVGDADGVRTAHAVEFFELLGGGKADAGWDGSGMSDARLAILPATTHYDIFSSPTLASTVAPFLDAPMPESE